MIAAIAPPVRLSLNQGAVDVTTYNSDAGKARTWAVRVTYRSGVVKKVSLLSKPCESLSLPMVELAVLTRRC